MSQEDKSNRGTLEKVFYYNLSRIMVNLLKNKSKELGWKGVAMGTEPGTVGSISSMWENWVRGEEELPRFLNRLDRVFLFPGQRPELMEAVGDLLLSYSYQKASAAAEGDDSYFSGQKPGDGSPYWQLVEKMTTPRGDSNPEIPLLAILGARTLHDFDMAWQNGQDGKPDYSIGGWVAMENEKISFQTAFGTLLILKGLAHLRDSRRDEFPRERGFASSGEMAKIGNEILVAHLPFFLKTAFQDEHLLRNRGALVGVVIDLIDYWLWRRQQRKQEIGYPPFSNKWNSEYRLIIESVVGSGDAGPFYTVLADSGGRFMEPSWQGRFPGAKVNIETDQGKKELSFLEAMRLVVFYFNFRNNTNTP